MFFIIIIVVIGLLIVQAIRHSRQADEAWRKAAGELGLRYNAGSWANSRAIKGQIDEFHVDVHTYKRGSGKNSRTYTRLRITYPSLGLGLKLSEEGFFTGITKVFGAQDIEVDGGGRFDAGVLIKGHDPRRVRAFLTSARRMRIHRFLQIHSGATIGDSEIEWSQRGVIRDTGQLVNYIRSLLRLGWHLTGEREEDETLERALHAQDEGHTNEALDILRSPPPLRRQAEPSYYAHKRVEEKVLEGELLYLGDRREEARTAFLAALEEDPDDADAAQWARHVTQRPQPPPLPGQAVRQEQPVEIASPEASQKAKPAGAVAAEPASAVPQQTMSGPPAADTSLDAATVCEELFARGAMSFQITRMFDERYEGLPVRWSGELRRVESYSYDFVFNNSEGCKAVVTLHELASVGYGDRTISAVVQFPKDQLEPLQERIGQVLEFAGTLKKVDALLRNIYVAEATMIGD